MSNQDIDRRIAFMGLSGGADALRPIAALLRQALPEALSSFYAQVRLYPEVRRFFRGEDHIAAAQAAQGAHWEAIIDGRHDAAYVQSVRAIGRVHARIGLEPRWYIGGYSLILDHLLRAVSNGRRMDRSTAVHDRETAEMISVLSRRVMLDMDLAISIYLEALEEDRQRARAEQDAVVASLGRGLGRLAAGDLGVAVADVFPEGYESLRRDFNDAVTALRDAVLAVAEGVEVMRIGSDELAMATDDLARRTEQQASILERTVVAARQITSADRKSVV